MSRSRLAIALGVVPLLVVGGCSEDSSGPRVAPRETSAAPTVSPSATPTGVVEPTMPAAAEGSGAAAAEAFIRYWFEVLSYAFVSGDTAGMSSLSSPGCVSCSALVEKIDDLYGKGGRLETRGWAVETAAKAPDYQRSRPGFLLRVRQAKRTLLDGDGAVVDRTPMAKVPMRVRVSSESGPGGWRLASLEILR